MIRNDHPTFWICFLGKVDQGRTRLSFSKRKPSEFLNVVFVLSPIFARTECGFPRGYSPTQKTWLVAVPFRGPGTSLGDKPQKVYRGSFGGIF